jgi:hypothetical protein
MRQEYRKEDEELMKSGLGKEGRERRMEGGRERAKERVERERERASERER